MLAHVITEILNIVGFIYLLTYIYRWLYPQVKNTKYKNTKYKKKHVFITGGTSGLGFALAKLFAKRGANVTITGSDESRLTAAVAEVTAVAKYESQKIGGAVQNFEPHAVTATDNPSKNTTGAAIEEKGPVDILICCAGRGTLGSFESIDQTRARNIMEINYWGTYRTIAEILPSMRKRNSGHIVAISSHCTVRSFEGYSAIAPSKMAVRGLMETLQAEYCETNVTFQLYHPTPMKTKGRKMEDLSKSEMTKAHEEYLYSDEDQKPEDVAENLVLTMESGGFYGTNATGLMEMEIVAQSTGWTTCGISRISLFLSRQLASWIHLFFDTSMDAYRKVVSEEIKKKKA